MYKKVVVPLDGSKMAELALPHVEEIAKACNVPNIMLVSATEAISGTIGSGQVYEPYVAEKPLSVSLPVIGVDQMQVVYNTHAYGAQGIPRTFGKMARTASEYLCRIAQDLENKGLAVTATVLLGDPAEQIMLYVNDQKADLIIIAGTGKSGMGRWNISNIAHKIIKDACVPVLLVKPPPGFKETKPRRRGVSS